MKKAFYLPLLAALALASCNNEDGPVNPDDGETKESGYVAVNIVQPRSAASSRAESPGFEYGSTDENTATTGLFFIFDVDGSTLIGEPQRLKLSGNGTGNSPEVERMYNAVLVVDGQDKKPDAGISIVCVLNAPVGLETGVTTLGQLTSKVEDYSAHTPGEFIMTSSVYKENGGVKVIGGLSVGPENIHNTASGAQKNPVNIYVERVVAKIRTNTSASFDNSGAGVSIDGNLANLDIKITGIEVANISKKAYLFKNIDGINLTWDWNDIVNKRTYWETMPGNMEYSNRSYNQIVNVFGSGFDIKQAKLTEYVQPNTSAQKTAVLVTAELQKDGNPISFVYLRGGYYSRENAMNEIARLVANSGYWKKTGATADATSYSQLVASDFEWRNNEDLQNAGYEWLERYEVVAQLTSAAAAANNLYKKNTDGTFVAVTPQEINNLLAGNKSAHPYVAHYYNGGKCYYYVNIDQSVVAGLAPQTLPGVVRNHIYDLTLNSISGLGTPIFDPDDIIIPETPTTDKKWFLGAQVHVLAWKIASQTVDFNGHDNQVPDPQ